MAVRTWTGLGANSAWSTAGNWDTGAPLDGDSVVFPDGAARVSNTFDIGTRTVSAITISGSYTINSSAGGLGLTGNFTISAGSWGISWQVILALGANITISNSNSLSGTTSLSGAINGAFNVIFTGAGTTRLTATNTYSGTTTINNGVCQLGNAGTTGVINTASAITVTSPGILEIYRSNAFALGTDCASTIAGTGKIRQAGAGTVAMSGNNSFSGGFDIAGAGVVTASGNNNAMGTGTITFMAGSVRLVVTDGLTLSNAITIGENSAAASRGLIENSSTANATLSGAITVNTVATAGGHFGSASTGTLTVSGAITSASASVSMGIGIVIFSGAGTGYAALSVRGGTARVGATNGISTTVTVTLGADAAATLDLGGFNQSLAAIAKSTNTATVGNSSTAANSTLTLTNNTTFAGVTQNVLGAGNKTTALTINGSGKTVTLSGANTYTGATTLTAGTLLITGSTGTSAVAVASGATLGGTGTVGGTITAASGGIVAPGLSGVAIGQLNTAAVNIPSGAVFSVDLNGTTPTFDKLNATGTVTLGGTLTIANYTNPAVGKVFTIMAATTLSGTFNGLADGATLTSGLRTLRVNYPANTVTLTDAPSAAAANCMLCFVP